LQPEKQDVDANPKPSGDCAVPELEWRRTSPERISGTPVFELPKIENDDAPISALDPANE
jgi:hypothetical protein